MLLIKIKFALRTLRRFSFFSFLNIFGLSISLVASITIFQFVISEYKVDSNLKNKDRIFRVIRTIEDSKTSYSSPTLSAVFRDQLSLDLNLSHEKILRVYRDDELITYDNKSFFEDNVLFVDQNFFSFFDYPFKLGNRISSLEKPNSAVISSSVAKKYFGDQNPLGKVMQLDGKGSLEITGVLEDFTTKGHLEIEFVVSMHAMGYTNRIMDEKDVHAHSYYVMLPSLTLEHYNTQLSYFNERYFADDLKSPLYTKLSLQPLREIYFKRNLRNDIALHGNEALAQSLLVIAILIILVTGANFINFSLTLSTKRVREVSVRKILGSSRISLISQSLLETFVTIGIAILITLLVNGIFSDYLKDYLQLQWTLEINFITIISIVGFLALLTLVFGLYPALISSRSRKSLSNPEDKVKTSLLQNGLLIFQFISALVLIIVTLIISKQFNYMQQKELGLSTEQIMLFNSNNRNSWLNKDRIKDEVAQIGNVVNLSTAYGVLPGSSAELFTYETHNSQFQWKTAFADHNLIEVLDLNLITGRNFDQNKLIDKTNSVLINEAAARELGWPEAPVVGSYLTSPDFTTNESKAVIGVIKDYHFESFKQQIEPLVISYSEWDETFVVKLAANNYQQTISDIEAVWKRYVPKHPFTFRFLDDTFQRLFEADTKQRKILYIFSALAIIIAGIGALGLSSLIMQTRFKEVAIRRVLGASTSSLIRLLSSSFFKTLLLANLVALPVAWYVSISWLSNFSYQTDLSADIFLKGSLLLATVITLLVLIQARNVTSVNPTDSLRTE